ncbi:MAG: 50S ribosomal protein L3 [Bacteroidetes bacterium RIFCSPLOWO2_02_FULL_36_8]|nr:MAG: 50S ribosomal protein L3 [Bacteroidetes bacterium RIFCSPLOWO2_02_FULL_36_8]OFY69397.1 MAG: 50S ribosomal protein L3 [Bacteroidetes bacterium RIFCSPLOWO2_12_FULL_37_12]
MPGLIGKKIGMTRLFDKEGKNIPCTVLQVGPCVVTQVKTVENEGYNAVQLAFDDKKVKSSNKAESGRFKKINSTPKWKVKEFSGYDNPFNPGDTLDVSFFKEGEKINAIGISKGKGFQGVVRRHHFSGVGGQTHGQHNRVRHPGSSGASSFPSKVVKGMRMAGRMGGDQVTLKNLQVVKIYPEENLLILKGCVPGPKNKYIILEK